MNTSRGQRALWAGVAVGMLFLASGMTAGLLAWDAWWFAWGVLMALVAFVGTACYYGME